MAKQNLHTTEVLWSAPQLLSRADELALWIDLWTGIGGVFLPVPHGPRQLSVQRRRLIGKPGGEFLSASQSVADHVLSFA
jgi:hypothetical protein